MEKITINDKTYGVEKLKATQAFKLQLKTVKLLGSGIFDGLKNLNGVKSIKDFKKMDTNNLFEALSDFITKTDDEEIYEFVLSLLKTNVYVIGKAEGEDVNIPLDIDTHMEDKLMDIFQLAIFVLKVNLGKSLAGLKSLMPSLAEKEKKEN